MLLPTGLRLILARLLLWAMVSTLSLRTRLSYLITRRMGTLFVTSGLLLLALLALLFRSPRLLGIPDQHTARALSSSVGVASNALGQLPPFPGDIGRTPLNVSSAVGNATLTLTFPAVVGQTNYVTGFELTVGGATTATSLTATITGIQGGTQSFLVAVPAVPASAVNAYNVEFTYPLKASGTNVAVVFTMPAAGAGNTNVTGAFHGYLQ